MTHLLSQPLITQRLPQLMSAVKDLKEKKKTPSLVVILCSNDPASKIYTRNKKKFMNKIGGISTIAEFPETIDPLEFQREVNNFIQDENVHGILIQRPLPPQLTPKNAPFNVDEMIPPEKDVDGLHPQNLGQLIYNELGENSLISCTPKGILTLLDYYKVPLAGKHVVVIGRSAIVGRPLSLLLTTRNATTTLCHSQTKNLSQHTKNADIIVTAIGKAHFLTSDFLHGKRRDQVLIDVGINKTPEGKLVGDIHFDEVAPLCAKITPVPGGVGPMTILSLAENVILAAKKQG